MSQKRKESAKECPLWPTQKNH